MFGLGPATKIYIAVEGVDMRKGFDGLFGLVRDQHAEGWAQEIRQECAKLAPTVLPKSALGKAVGYTLNMWPKLRRCFEYAELELSNNLAENSMRPVTLGRKNWLHVGSVKAGPKVAAILSVRGILPQVGRAPEGLPVRHPTRPRPSQGQRNPSVHAEPLGCRPHLILRVVGNMKPSDTGSNAECDPARRRPWNRQRGALDSC